MVWDLSAIPPDQFHQLCGHLLTREYTGFRPVEGSGGDEGVDGWVPDTGTYFQFHAPKSRLRKEKIQRYLEQVSRHGPKRWVLLTNRELTRTQWGWIQSVQQQYQFPVEVWGPARISQLISNHPGFEEYVHSLARHSQPRIGVHVQRAETIANIVAGDASRVTVKGLRPRVNVSVAGTVAEDPFRVGYLEYLIKRYNEFKEWEIGRDKMKVRRHPRDLRERDEV